MSSARTTMTYALACVAAGVVLAGCGASGEDVTPLPSSLPSPHTSRTTDAPTSPSASARASLSASPGSAVSSSSPASVTSSFDKTRYSTADPSSIWVVVNKQHPLHPKSYAPKLAAVPAADKYTADADTAEVGAVMEPHLAALIAAERTAVPSNPLSVISGYRSYAAQVAVYGREVATKGQKYADTISARPGFSEHQTGLAADVIAPDASCGLSDGLTACLGQTPGGRWLTAHAADFGFIIRYTAQNQPLTGYDVEPWHVRYVGVALAKEMKREHVDTLEQFFGVGGGTVYIR